MIGYWLDCAEPQRTRVRWALELLLEGIGIGGYEASGPAESLIVYTATRPKLVDKRKLWIRAEPDPRWHVDSTRIAASDGLPMLVQTVEPEAAEPGCVPFDILLSTFLIAAGVFEDGQGKDPWGVVVGRRSRLFASGLLDIPVVSHYANYLAVELERALEGRLVRVPRWPQDKRFCICLTHDVDTIWLNSQAADLIRTCIRYTRHLSPRLLKAAAALAQHGARRLAGQVPAPEQDPNLCLREWADFEINLGTRSCFYVSVRPRWDDLGTHQDVVYDAGHPVFVRAMREVAERGFEIGLHASIRAHEDVERLISERERLTSLLGGIAPAGLRHHYWAMGASLPERTMHLHAQAGFSYDSSLGLNDCPGFRRGLAWPFRPYDRDQDTVLPLLQIPPTLMDGSIYYARPTVEEGIAAIRAHLHIVAQAGGAAVLDWHQEQLNPTRLHGAGAALCSVLTDLAANSDVYWASPSQLSDWWRERRARIRATPAMAL